MSGRKAKTTSRARSPRRTAIDKSDLPYHRKIIKQVKEAQAAMQEIERLQGIVGAADAAFRSWGEHLHQKYRLKPGDGVDEQGRITRAPAPAPPQKK